MLLSEEYDFSYECKLTDAINLLMSDKEAFIKELGKLANEYNISEEDKDFFYKDVLEFVNPMQLLNMHKTMGTFAIVDDWIDRHSNEIATILKNYM